MNKTSIEWAEFTSNPVKGKCPVDCSYCYVKSFRERYGWPDDIAFHPEELERIKRRKQPANIFMGSTIELFHDQTIQYMPEIMETVKDCPQHTIMFLTKQPQNLVKFSPFPDNCYVGVSATDYWAYVNACNYLSQVEAKVKYLSLEPLLSWGKEETYFFESGGINQVIIGCQTKPTVMPRIEWVADIVEAADQAGVAVFLKDSLKPLISVHHEWAWKNDNYRQEMPR